jgi:hypothetical protein
MPVNRKKARAVKAAAPAKVSRRKVGTDWTPEEVVHLETQVENHKRSEQAWQRLTDAGDDDDRWTNVEEHLLSRDQKSAGAERRWKFFSK